mgnify:CR=1 FL=1
MMKRASDVPPVVVVSGDADGERWHVAVSDNGRGIPEADRGTVFELFARLPSTDGVVFGTAMFTLGLRAAIGVLAVPLAIAVFVILGYFNGWGQ